MSEHCLIKKNTPELRKKLEDAGLSVCICTTFEDADWLSCWGLMKRLYVLIDQKLDAVYGCVQGGHAVAIRTS